MSYNNIGLKQNYYQTNCIELIHYGIELSIMYKGRNLKLKVLL